MRRKVIKQKTAYTITLPVKWARHYNIEKNREVDIEEEGNNLIISTQGKESHKEVDIKLESSEEQYCRIMIENPYLRGFDTLNIKFSDKETMPIIQNIVSNLVGVEIVKQDKTFCVVAQTAMPTTEEFKPLFNRCISILSYSINFVEEAIKTNVFDRLEEIEQLTKDARRFLLFLTRTLHKVQVVDKADETYFHLLLERLILIQHNQFYLYKKMSKLQTNFVNRSVEKTYLKATESFKTFVKQLHKQDMKNFTKISKTWEEIYFDHKQYVDCTKEESVVLYHAMHLAKLTFLISQPGLTEQFKYIET